MPTQLPRPGRPLIIFLFASVLVLPVTPTLAQEKPDQKAAAEKKETAEKKTEAKADDKKKADDKQADAAKKEAKAADREVSMPKYM